MKKNAAKKITAAKFQQFVGHVIHANLRAIDDVTKASREIDHMEWEEHEEADGTYFLTYWAKTIEDAIAFSDRARKIAEGKYGWQFEGVEERYGKKLESWMSKEPRGSHRGRYIFDMYIAPAGTWEE